MAAWGVLLGVMAVLPAGTGMFERALRLGQTVGGLGRMFQHRGQLGPPGAGDLIPRNAPRADRCDPVFQRHCLRHTAIDHRCAGAATPCDIAHHNSLFHFGCHRQNRPRLRQSPEHPQRLALQGWLIRNWGHLRLRHCGRILLSGSGRRALGTHSAKPAKSRINEGVIAAHLDLANAAQNGRSMAARLTRQNADRGALFGMGQIVACADWNPLWQFP